MCGGLSTTGSNPLALVLASELRYGLEPKNTIVLAPEIANIITLCGFDVTSTSARLGAACLPPLHELKNLSVLSLGSGIHSPLESKALPLHQLNWLRKLQKGAPPNPSEIRLKRTVGTAATMLRPPPAPAHRSAVEKLREFTI